MTIQSFRKVVHILIAGLLLIGQLPVGPAIAENKVIETSSRAKPIPAVGSPQPATAELPAGVGKDWWSAAQANIRQAEYEVSWQEQTYLTDVPAAYQAPNRAQNLRAYFTPEGLRLIPRKFQGEKPPWEWGLSLRDYGYVGAVQSLPAPELHAEGNRVEYRHEDLTEWFVNEERGLEQGFTLQEPPSLNGVSNQSDSSGSEIALSLNLSGNLTAQLAGDRKGIEFTTSGGVRVLQYDKLQAHDAVGRTLHARMELISSGQNAKRGLMLAVDTTGAVYPITVDPLTTSPSWTAAR